MNFEFCDIFKNKYLVEQPLLYLPYCIPDLYSPIVTPGSAVSVCDIATTRIANNKYIPFILSSLSGILYQIFQSFSFYYITKLQCYANVLNETVLSNQLYKISGDLFVYFYDHKTNNKYLHFSLRLRNLVIDIF